MKGKTIVNITKKISEKIDKYGHIISRKETDLLGDKKKEKEEKVKKAQ